MNLSENSRYLGEEKINRLMVKFSVPCILSLLVSSLYNIVDQIFIGNSELSTLGNAATGVVFPVFIIAQAFAWCLGDGCAAYLNICQGRNDDENAHRAIGSSVTVAFLSGVAMIALILPFRVPILTLFGASENTMAYAVEYLNIVLVMMPVYILCNMMNSTIRADGSPSWAMASMLVGAITNIILDPLFIFVFKMGMTGAALATVIGQGATFLMSGWYFMHTKTFRLKKSSFVPALRPLMEVVKLGVSTFITQLAIVLVAVVCNIQLSRFGAMSKYGADIPIAVIGIQSKIFTVIINLVVGIVLGCQPIISYNMGAQKYDRVRELYRKIIGAAFAIGVFFTLLLELAPQFALGLFGQPSNIPNPEDYWDFGVKTMRIFLSLVSISCLIKTNSIFFQAVGKPLYATVSSIIRDVVCFVPLILILPAIFSDVVAILYAAPIADLLAMGVTAFLSVSFLRSLKREENKLRKTL
ncbi:MAG: MATE family efflux transporter [Clostridia bacterium]|nr:MATE family efflux transporter [Clostridia bacterium]